MAHLSELPSKAAGSQVADAKIVLSPVINAFQVWASTVKPELRPTILGVDLDDTTREDPLIVDDHLAGDSEIDDWGRDPDLEHIKRQLTATDAEELEHVGDVIPRQKQIKGALGPVETSSNGITVGLAESFDKLPSGGVRRLRDTIGTHSSVPIIRLSGDVVNTSRPKVAAREMGRIQSLRREAIARVSGKKADQKPNAQYAVEWGVEALGPDVEESVEQLTQDQVIPEIEEVSQPQFKLWGIYKEELEDAPNADDRSEPFKVRIELLAEADDLIVAADRGEVEIVSAEELAAQEARDPNIAERRAEVREALQTVREQEII